LDCVSKMTISTFRTLPPGVSVQTRECSSAMDELREIIGRHAGE
jgi:hypothetical protein